MSMEDRMQSAGAQVDAEQAASEPEVVQEVETQEAQTPEDVSTESADLEDEDDSDDEVADTSKKNSRYSRTVQKLKETNKDLESKFAQSQQDLQAIYQRQIDLEARIAKSQEAPKKVPETAQEIAEDIFESKTVELKQQLKELKAEKEAEKMNKFMLDLDQSVNSMWAAEELSSLKATDQKVFKDGVKDFIASGLLHWKGGSQESVAGAFRAVVMAAARMENAKAKANEKIAVEKSKTAPKVAPTGKTAAISPLNTVAPDINSSELRKFYPADNAILAWDKAYSDGFSKVPKTFFK